MVIHRGVSDKPLLDKPGVTALTITFVFSTIHEVGRQQGLLTNQEYVLFQVPTNQE